LSKGVWSQFGFRNSNWINPARNSVKRRHPRKGETKKQRGKEPKNLKSPLNPKLKDWE
jgi:hypothetical protein